MRNNENAVKKDLGIIGLLKREGKVPADYTLQAAEMQTLLEPYCAFTHDATTWKLDRNKINIIRDPSTKNIFGGILHLSRKSPLQDITPDASFAEKLKCVLSYVNELNSKEEFDNTTFNVDFAVYDEVRQHFTRLYVTIHKKIPSLSDKQDNNTSTWERRVTCTQVDNLFEQDEEKYNQSVQKKGLSKIIEILNNICTFGHINSQVRVNGASYKKNYIAADIQQQQDDKTSCGFLVAHSLLCIYQKERFSILQKIGLIQHAVIKEMVELAHDAEINSALIKMKIEGNIPPENIARSVIYLDNNAQEITPAATTAPIPPVVAAATTPPTAAVATTPTIFDKEFDQLGDKKIELIRKAFVAITKKIACLVDVKLEIAKDDKDQEKILFSKDNNTCEVHLIHTYSDYKTSSEKTSAVLLKRTVTPKDTSKSDSKDTVEWTCTSEKLSLQQKYQLIAVQIFEMRAANQNALKKSGIQHHEIEVLPLDGKAPTNAPSTEGDINKLADPEKMVIQAFFTAGFKKVVYCGESFKNPAASVSTASLFHTSTTTATQTSAAEPGPGSSH